MKDLILLETIKILDGEAFHLELHNQRMNHSRKVLFGSNDFINIKEHLKIPSFYKNGLVKCSIIYKQRIEEIKFTFYKKRKIKKLKIIQLDEIDYSFKYADRSVFEKLTQNLSSEEDILIIKKGFLTDTSFSNVVLLEKSSMKWFTPSTPLLKGTKREFLLNSNQIFEKEIKLSDFENYSHIELINSMLDFGKNSLNISIKNIII